jgi:nitrite reductase (NADH) large subunit
MAGAQAWICTVCGYVHQGDEAPEVCAVCGATRELFEPYEAAAPAKTEVQAWICTVCGYIHEGPEPPEVCPVCAAGADMFEPHPVEPKQAVPVTATSTKKHVIIAGAGIAGVSAAEAVRKANPDARITLLSKESELPYYRLNLTRYLADEIKADSLSLHPKSWYQEKQIDLVCGAELCTLAPEKKVLHLRRGDDLSYDQLVLAVGAHPFVPPIPGIQREHVTSLRTHADADRILAQARAGGTCAVIGGGILGLEAAGALARRGMKVTVLEGFGWLLPRQLNAEAGAVLEEQVRARSIEIRKKAVVRELVGDQRVREVLLEGGDTLHADLVIVTTGVRSNSYIARLAGLEVNEGVVVDNHMRTSFPDILAAGDVAEHHGICYGVWGPAQFQGTIAGMNATGASSEFGGLPRSNMLKVLGFDMFSIGRIQCQDGSDLAVQARAGDNYSYFLFHDSHLVGAILLGDTRLAAQTKTVIEHRTDCSRLLKQTPTAGDVLAFLKDGM